LLEVTFSLNKLSIKLSIKIKNTLRNVFGSNLFFKKSVYNNNVKNIKIVKNKLEAKIIIQDLKIEDKSFLHKNHKGNQEGMFHLKLIIKSVELKKLNKIESTKKIYSILDLELKEHIHSIQILLS